MTDWTVGQALIGSLDFDTLARLASLLLLPFANEDVAVVGGAYIVNSSQIHPIVVAACIYTGMVGSDFALYAIGVGARHLPWLGRFVDRRAVQWSGPTLQEMIALVTVCRITPGAEFVAFVACGWARVPLARFVPAVLLVSALYLPIILYLSVIFGDALDDQFGLWAWPLVLAAATAAAYARSRLFGFDRHAPGAAFSAHQAVR